ncbi:MAG TPA: hypothetical protein VIL98_04805 [Gaiellaceae bacterium]|jgi:hypothetical protein
MKRLVLVLAATLALVPSAGARQLAGPTPFHAASSAPAGLHAFLLRPDEAPLRYYPRTPSFSWSPVTKPSGTYTFELATSRGFSNSSVLFTYTKIAIPVLAVPHQLPWMTGLPYALWAHVRWESANGKIVTPWSQPFGFNMRWTDDDYPQQLTAPEGLIRWKPIEGATRYEVLFPDIRPAESFQTTTNVADEREFFTLHDTPALTSAIHWRVRALRNMYDAELKNGLPRVSYGPWSKLFTSVNPPQSLGLLSATDTISDAWDKKGKPASPHELTPGFAWAPSAPTLSQIGAFGSNLYRVYIFTDDHCVNVIFKGSVVGSPAYAPRTQGGPLNLPQSTADLTTWTDPPYFIEHGVEGKSTDATGQVVVSAESTASPGVDAKVDLWDSGWPNSRYYWTVVPVSVEPSGLYDPNAASHPIAYEDLAIPQDSCEAGLGMSFSKISQPAVTASSTNVPWVTGVNPNGRVVASASKVPAVHDSPLVAWEPAVGATKYDVEVSHQRYPWKAGDRHWQTAATAIVLPLDKGPTSVGLWWYRVRGINPALPVGADTMTWSKPVGFRVTGDRFVIVK